MLFCCRTPRNVVRWARGEDMTLTQMQHFLAVCQTGSLTQAAGLLHVTQPAVSASIKGLEREFNLNLFHRVSKKLTLTSEGEFFLARARTILEGVEALEQQMFDLGHKRNMLRIGVPPMIGATYFPALYHAFHQKYPQIQVEIFEAGSLEMRELIDREELDLALAIMGTEPMPSYEVLPLHDTEYVYCVGSHHPLAEKQRISLSEIADTPMILFQAGSVQIRAVREKLEAVGKRPNVLLYSSNVYTVCGYLEHYDAGAFLFPEVLEHNPSLRAIPLEEPWPVEIGLMWKKNKQLYTDVTTFISFCKQYQK